MDVTFSAAVRNASNAWSQSHTVDAMSLATLSRRELSAQQQALADAVPTAGKLAVLQPELARFGQMGTRLNIYA